MTGSARENSASFGAVLIEDGNLGVLKNGVAGGVAGFELLLDFGGEFVVGILGFPPAARETEFVANGAVGHDALAAGVSGEFGDERPTALPGGFVEEVLEWSFQAEFMDDLVIFEVLKVFNVGPDDRVGGGEVEHRMYESYRKPSATLIMGSRVFHAGVCRRVTGRDTLTSIHSSRT